MKNIAVFASGNGSNFKNLIELSEIDYLKGKIKLLITDRECNAKKIALEKNIENIQISKNDDEKLLKAIDEHSIDLIVLAGYLSKIPENLIEKYYGKIINIHPALLPSFGGKGFYGEKVHKSVIEKECKLSGITIHFVDKDYDSGPIILQKSIPLTNKDTLQTLQNRIHLLEYFYYPYTINMILEGIISLVDNKVIIENKLPSSKHALISVSDKEGIVELAKNLNKNGYLIIATGKTFQNLKENKIKVLPVEALTGFNEILDGRVKTLNNIIFASILAKRKKEEHIKEINQNFIPLIDVVVVNLYPFENVSKTLNSFDEILMENIDIGGPTLIRASAKNWQDLVILTDKNDYPSFIEKLNSKNIDDDFRKHLSIKAFNHTYLYDKCIFEKLSDSKKLTLELRKIQDLRYGENPHQKASFYTSKSELPFEKLWGKELSYNNILDAYGSWQAVSDFEKPACVIFKHLTPCGIAIDNDITKAFDKAYNSDALSAFGGIIALNRKITKDIAEFLSKKFIEIISAPDFDDEAIKILTTKKNLRILKWKKDIRNSQIIRSVGDEFIISDSDNIVLGEKWEVVSGDIDDYEKEALIFAFTCVKHIRSNAIVITSNDTTLGIGAGQMSRIDALRVAEFKLNDYLKSNPRPKLLVMASDAFFPFPDSIIKAKEIGISAIIQPGGSINDDEVIKKARELKIKMVISGIRHFKH